MKKLAPVVTGILAALALLGIIVWGRAAWEQAQADTYRARSELVTAEAVADVMIVRADIEKKDADADRWQDTVVYWLLIITVAALTGIANGLLIGGGILLFMYLDNQKAHKKAHKKIKALMRR